MVYLVNVVFLATVYGVQIVVVAPETAVLEFYDVDGVLLGTAAGVARLLADVAASRRIALIVVSHLEPLVALLSPTHQVLLERARPEDLPCARPVSSRRQFARLPFAGRVWRRLGDYLLYSLPLVVCAFAATGAAVAMLLADMMERIDTVEVISSFLKESLEGNPVLPMVLGLVDQIVRANEAAAKQKAAGGKATAAALQKKLAAQKEAASAVEAAQNDGPRMDSALGCPTLSFNSNYRLVRS